MHASLFFIAISLIAAFLYVGYEAFTFYSRVRLGARLSERTAPFARSVGEEHILVLGDSTAVGVGASVEGAVPARLSKLLNASVENYAWSGARTRHLLDQLNRAEREKYDLIHIQVGANDVIRFSQLRSTERSLDELLQLTKKRSDRVMVLTAGWIGDAPSFPKPIGWIMNARTARFREMFMRVAEKHDVVFVDIAGRPDPFGAEPERYYSPDMLHLSDNGYEFWFGIVREYVERAWPELIPKSN